MALVRITNKQASEGKGRIDEARFDALTEDEIEGFIREDGIDLSTLGEPYCVPRKVDLRALRKRLGLSQAKFAKRYYLSLRSVQQWEQEQREPSEAARVLLFAIENDPEAIETALHKKKAS
jgi:putative transcriptional regulator